MAAGRAADLLQPLLVDAVDNPALHHGRLVALSDADRLDRDLGLGRFAGGGGRIDAGIRGAVGQQDDHRIVLGLGAIRVGDAGELGDRNLDRGTDRRTPAGPKRTQGVFHRAFIGG